MSVRVCTNANDTQSATTSAEAKDMELAPTMTKGRGQSSIGSEPRRRNRPIIRL